MFECLTKMFLALRTDVFVAGDLRVVIFVELLEAFDSLPRCASPTLALASLKMASTEERKVRLKGEENLTSGAIPRTNERRLRQCTICCFRCVARPWRS